MNITKEIYELIDFRIKEFIGKTAEFNDVDFEDVVFSYLYSTEDTFWILNDWNEGENNDPFLNKERNEHSVMCFLQDITNELRELNGLDKFIYE